MGDDVLPEFDSDFNASDGGTPRWQPALVTVLNGSIKLSTNYYKNKRAVRNRKTTFGSFEYVAENVVKDKVLKSRVNANFMNLASRKISNGTKREIWRLQDKWWLLPKYQDNY